MPVGRAPEIPGLSRPHTYKSPSLHHISAFHIYNSQKYVCCMLMVSLVAAEMYNVDSRGESVGRVGCVPPGSRPPCSQLLSSPTVSPPLPHRTLHISSTNLPTLWGEILHCTIIFVCNMLVCLNPTTKNQKTAEE